MSRRGWRLGVVAMLSITAVIYIALQIFLFEVSQFYIPMAVLIIAMFSGIFVKLMVRGKPSGIYTMLDTDYLWMSIVLILVGFIVIQIIGIFIASTMVIEDMLFAGMAAICESWCIAGFQDAIDYMTGEPMVGIVGGASIACVLHWRVYGTLPHALLFVLFAFLVFNTMYYISGRRIEVPMIIHLMINLL